MQEILISLIDAFGQQALAMAAVADEVSALKKTLLFHYPEIADDLNANVAAQRKTSREHVENMQQMLAQLREAVSRLSN